MYNTLPGAGAPPPPARLFRAPWADDAAFPACFGCRTPFTLFNRRHHCRHCGFVFCKKCAGEKIPLATALGFGAAPQRVCRGCRGAAALTVAPILCWRAGFAAHAFAQDTLALEWRVWLTRALMERYFRGEVFYRLERGRSGSARESTRAKELGGSAGPAALRAIRPEQALCAQPPQPTPSGRYRRPEKTYIASTHV